MNETGTFLQNDLSSEFRMEPSFRMKMLEVYNWGPFDGKHCCEIDAEGSAIIGPTGSGKTTLVDGLMTLLAPFPKYNLASTGGHESDRDLISYVRGVSGVESAEEGNSHVARPAKTMTGLAVTYASDSEQVTIGAILWVESSSNAADDLKRLWFFSKDMAGRLDQLLEMHHQDGAKHIKRYARETTGLRTFDSKKDYLAQVRSFFEVGENAFTLLNRAAGLKQINSIDQIFRELVLNDRSTFNRAREVVQEFETLQGIYQELETARRQRDSLLPVQDYQSRLDAILAKLENYRHLEKLLPIWFAGLATELWEKEVSRIKEEIVAIRQQLESLQSDENISQARADALNKQYMEVGGAAIQGLETTIKAKKELAQHIRKNADDYRRIARQLLLDEEPGENSFRRNLEALPEMQTHTEKAREQARQYANEAGAELLNHRRDFNKLEDDIRDVRARPGSGVKPEFQAFREQLSTHLNLKAKQLPFVAELIEVKPEENRWRGAIERAIGSERLRILVAAERMREALAWVNGRDNKLHVRLQSADTASTPTRQCFDDGFVTKLNFTPHPFTPNVNALLSGRDRHCVASPDELRRTEHGMTVEGTMSDRDGRFEKQDQRPLNQGWMTGFSNEHQLREMLDQFAKLQSLIEGLEREEKKRSKAEDEHRDRLLLIDQLRRVEFSQIDVASIDKELRELESQLEALMRPDSDVARLHLEYKTESARLHEIRKRTASINQNLGSSETALKNADEQHQNAATRKGGGLNDDDATICQREFPVASIETARKVATAEQDAGARLTVRIQKFEEQKIETSMKLVSRMAAAKKEDTGALAETGTELRDVPDYLNRLKTLLEEALPDKLKRFREYLGISSGQGVTQLLRNIESEVSIIEERVRDLNATLSRVDFRPGQYLELITEKTVHESLRQVQTALRKLRNASLNSEDDDGDGQYRALGEVIKLIREAVEKKDNLASRALLDPRHRLQFGVVEVDRSTGQRSGRRTGSQTGSGGEKEMMASYILTASLSYALSAPGAPRPRYATIVLDEAFSKSSPAAAARIIKALRIFGLHPLFVTPNKEMALLKANTRSAIIVHNKNKRATLTSLTWQQIEAHERKQATPVS